MNPPAVQDAWMLILIGFALGAKHGIDPDHLATIDGLARVNTERHPRLARWSGFLFSLGHGLVVTLVAALAAALPGKVSVPAWLEHSIFKNIQHSTSNTQRPD